MPLPSQTDILIAGGGLAGLRLAGLLTDAGADYHLIDRRTRFGGRVLGFEMADAAFDLGPAWFWPGQPRMAALTAFHQLPVFEQYATGAFRFEDARGQVQQGGGPGSMQGSFRISGGIAALCSKLEAGLDDTRLHSATTLQQLTRTSDGIRARMADGTQTEARRLVLALPPRIAATLSFAPALPAETTHALGSLPTWMAGHAKAVAVYDQPFWRDAGLSGDAMSQHGPMVEIHDASPADARCGALFGFMGVPPAQRRDTAALSDAVGAQLVRLFGPRAASPRRIEIKDWAFDPATATKSDHAPLTAHPRYYLPAALDGLWDGALVFGGTEVAPGFGGFLEGALEAAENAFARVIR